MASHHQFKEFKPRNRCLPPSRALLAERGGEKHTATWVVQSGQWRCFSASRGFQWMRGMTDLKEAQRLLRPYKWDWIVPLFGRAIEPPFTNFPERATGLVQPHAPAHHLPDGSLGSGYPIVSAPKPLANRTNMNTPVANAAGKMSG